jgi:probable HAF family extracellular repeat protein
MLIAFAIDTPVRARTPSFTPVGVSPSFGYDVSADGSVVAGTVATFYAFRWTPGGGLQPIVLPPGLSSGDGRAISADGSTVVGSWRNGMTGQEAARLSSPAGPLELGGVAPGINRNFAYDASADGSVIVGKAVNASGNEEAFRWTNALGMQPLGVLSGFSSSSANGVSSDGSIVVGSSRRGFPPPIVRAFRWTADTGMLALGPPGVSSEAVAVSDDGSAVVGVQGTRAVRWSGDDTLDLGSLPGFETFEALGVTADGSVVVGEASTFTPTSRYEPFIWDQVHGMRSLTGVLGDLGVQIPSGWQLQAANAVSADGLTIVGTGVNPSNQFEAWIAVIPEPAALPMLAAASGVLFMYRRRRRVSEAEASAHDLSSPAPRTPRRT